MHMLISGYNDTANLFICGKILLACYIKEEIVNHTYVKCLAIAILYILSYTHTL